MSDIDITERLRNISRGDHERGCNGRSYTCSCGYDDVNEKTAEDAAAEIERLRAETQALKASLRDHKARHRKSRAEAFERAAQIAEKHDPDYWGSGHTARLVQGDIASAIRQASGESGTLPVETVESGDT